MDKIRIIVVDDHPLFRDGVAAAREIAVECPTTNIIMLTVSEDEEHVHSALKAGARAYVLKGVTARELLGIVRDVDSGGTYLPPSLALSLLVDSTAGSPDPAAKQSILDELTTREREILELLATGLKNLEIAERLELSEKTVKHHITNILQKLQVRNRVEATIVARDIDRETAT